MERLLRGLRRRPLQQTDQYVEVPSTMTGRGENYALNVEGDSTDRGPGSWTATPSSSSPARRRTTGEIVVALVEEQEVTLKRLRRRGESVALEPANAAYETRIFPPDRVRFSGSPYRSHPQIWLSHGRRPRTAQVSSGRSPPPRLLSARLRGAP